MGQLMVRGVVPGDPDSAAKAFTDLKAELEKEKAARETSQIQVNTLTRAVEGLKISPDKFYAQIPILEDKVKYLKNKVIDGLNEIRARELCLERSTRANDDYKSHNAQLTKKLEGKSH
jgi:hypothetical protein